MTKEIIKFFTVLILLSSLLSCDTSVVFTDSAPIPDEKWHLTNITDFNFSIDDTLNRNNIFFTIRTGSSYPFRNIYLFVTTFSPDGRSITDTLNYNLADEKGNWYGKGFGDIHELNLSYKSNVYFPLKGTYNIKVQHGMRVEDLKGVYDLGVRIERISK